MRLISPLSVTGGTVLAGQNVLELRWCSCSASGLFGTCHSVGAPQLAWRIRVAAHRQI